ncbi:pseudouridine synthase [Cephaloticoccus primus]|uniref:pseudouridine synthase n=1 Tax=Cephaloticoccus primus TaxID=1548207 RepID=UPI0009ED4415|nr:pseudouridine synthase [Cephaloticoccus primus]
MTHHTPVRIQKHLADIGLCSRRAAEELIRQGEVWVNAARAELGQKIVPDTDKVTVRGKPVRATAPQPRLTLAVHKPRGLVCSNDDPHNPATIFDLLPRELARHRFFCAGRLDKDSEGLVILTTDGDLANRLMHPSNTVVKRYHVTLKQPYPADRLGQLLRGVTIEGEKLRVEYAALLHPSPTQQNSTELDVHLHHGKKREIRQLFLALRYDVKRLRRYQVGAFPLKGIPLRAGKILSPREINLLFETPAPSEPPARPGRLRSTRVAALPRTTTSRTASRVAAHTTRTASHTRRTPARAAGRATTRALHASSETSRPSRAKHGTGTRSARSSSRR